MALRKNSRKLIDFGNCQNLPDEFPTVEQLKGNTKILAGFVGVKSALHVVEAFSPMTDFFDDGFEVIVAMREKRIRRDYYDGGLDLMDLSRKYGICILRLKQIVGLINKEAKILC